MKYLYYLYKITTITTVHQFLIKDGQLTFLAYIWIIFSKFIEKDSNLKLPLFNGCESAFD